MEIIKESKIIKNVQIALNNNDEDSKIFSCMHADVMFAHAGLYLHYLDEEEFYWLFTINDETYNGKDILSLGKLIKSIKNELQSYKDDKNIYLLVYTYNLVEVKAFFKDYIKEYCSSEVIVNNAILLRDIKGIAAVSSLEDFAVDWMRMPVNTVPSVLFAEFSDQVYNEYTIIDSTSKIFKTSAQIAKHYLKTKFNKYHECWLIDQIPSKDIYEIIRHNVFRASLCMNHYSDKTYNNVQSHDQSSAHCHKLVTKEFPVSKPMYVKELKHDINWYLENKFCWFKATFKNCSLKEGFEHLDAFKIFGDRNPSLYLDQIQLQAFNLFYDYDDIIISDLIVADKGYLPKWLRCACADMYLDKAAYPTKDAHRNSLKVKLNAGCYGIFVERLYLTEEEYANISNGTWRNQWKTRVAPPQVGVSITSYVFLDECRIIAANPKAFVYCDTDSVKYVINDYTINEINKRNNESHAEMKKFCDEFDYDYELMKDLGEYKLDGKYDIFKSISAKEYIYQKDNKLGATTAGYASQYYVSDLSTEYEFDKDRIPVVLYEPIKKGLDPFRYFTNTQHYTDYKWCWNEEKLRKYRLQFHLTNYENAMLTKKLEANYRKL